MTGIKSYGKCIFCNKEFSEAAISRHLASHLAKNAAGESLGNSYHVRIENIPDSGASLYFLNIGIDGKATFRNLDIFLRQIWLECCGHGSEFRIIKQKNPNEQSLVDAESLLMEIDPVEINRDTKVEDIFTKGLQLEYEYDFGSTTALKITVLEQYPVSAGENIVLLSRNEPLAIMCDLCGKNPATQICSVCRNENANVFCDGCAGLHAETCIDFAQYGAMPVVNSPRMGVCGYEGSLITTESGRDGAYVKR